MANLLRNPHEAIQPDFAAEEHAPQRQLLREGGLAEDQAVALLSNLWVTANLRDRAEWDCSQEQRALAQLEAEQAAHQEIERQRQEEEALREAARLEDRKKNKKKFAPVIDAPIPIGQVDIPAPIAVARMKKAEYVELWYFTNAGLRSAESSAIKSSKNNNSFILVHDEDTDAATFVPASTAAAPSSSALVEDEDLSWEEFTEAAPRMLAFMGLQEWPQDRIRMFLDFWGAIQTHPWRHIDDALSQRALLAYQGIQRKKWHVAVGTTISWSLAKICEVTLSNTRSALTHKEQVKEIDSIRKVSPPLFFSLSTRLTRQSLPPITCIMSSPTLRVALALVITRSPGFSSRHPLRSVQSVAIPS